MNHDSDRNDNWKQKYGAKGESLGKELSIAADYSANLSTPNITMVSLAKLRGKMQESLEEWDIGKSRFLRSSH